MIRTVRLKLRIDDPTLLNDAKTAWRGIEVTRRRWHRLLVREYDLHMPRREPVRLRLPSPVHLATHADDLLKEGEVEEFFSLFPDYSLNEDELCVNPSAFILVKLEPGADGSHATLGVLPTAEHSCSHYNEASPELKKALENLAATLAA